MFCSGQEVATDEPKNLEYALSNRLRKSVLSCKKCKYGKVVWIELEGGGVTDLLMEASRECLEKFFEECVRGGEARQKSVMMKDGVKKAAF